MTALTAVLTTIQPPTPSTRQLAEEISRLEGRLIIVGDANGPQNYPLSGSQFMSLEDQLATEFTLAQKLPVNCYSRKNIGYLQAISEGAGCIYETDDDNAPIPAFFELRSQEVDAQPVEARGWFNVYRAFSDELVWPRGFPLNKIRDPASFAHDLSTPLQKYDAPVQQGLHDGSPDADAIWRLVMEQQITFFRRPSLWLPADTWSPINSQSTWWWPSAYPLMYMPSHATGARMLDIWRGFVTQRCLWELGHGVVFHAAEVRQERNPHDYMNDFELELAGYLGNQSVAVRLAGLTLAPGQASLGANLLSCYEVLVEDGFLRPEELALVEAWLDDLRELC